MTKMGMGMSAVKSIMEGKAAVPSDEEFKSTGMEEGNTA
jgi:hypothetical protein